MSEPGSIANGFFRDDNIIAEMIKDIPKLKLDRSKLKIVTDLRESVSDELAYWKNTTVRERLQHIERLRRQNYGARATARLQRVVRIVECECKKS